jgi:hypothetical protein
VKAGPRFIIVVALLIWPAACASKAATCQTSPRLVDEQAIVQLLDRHIRDGQALVDGPRSIPLTELPLVQVDGVVSEGEVINDGDSAVRLIAYRSKRLPVLSYLVSRRSDDACARELSWRIAAP